MWMSHPDLPDNVAVEVAESAFADNWRHRGWVEAYPPPPPPEEGFAGPAELVDEQQQERADRFTDESSEE